MGVQPKKPTVKGPAAWFTGDVWIDSIVQPNDHSTLNVGAVHFAPVLGPPGTPMKVVRRSTSPKAAASSSHAARISSCFGPVTSTSRRTPNSTGTVAVTTIS